MKRIIKKENRIRFENSPKCIAYEYPLEDKDINVAVIEIDGRYPDKGFVVNEKVKELVLVTKGKGKIVIENKELAIDEGDAVLIQPMEKYFFEGKLEIAATCSPAWYPEQHKAIQ